MIIKPLIKIHVDPATREQRLQELLAERTDVTSGTAASSGKFSAERFPDRYVLNHLPMPFSDGNYTLELSRELLDGGKNHTLPEYTKTPSYRFASGKPWDLLSAPDYFTIMLALEQHQNTAGQEAMIKEVKELLNNDFRLSRYLLTKSVVRYGAGQPQGGMLGRLKSPTPGIDSVIHDYGASNPQRRQEALVGPNDWVVPGKNQENGLYALTGVRDLDRMVRAVEFVTGVKPYWWRLNNTPSQDAERALVLGVNNSDRFSINANGYVSNDRPARGVVVRKIFSP